MAQHKGASMAKEQMRWSSEAEKPREPAAEKPEAGLPRFSLGSCRTAARARSLKQAAKTSLGSLLSLLPSTVDQKDAYSRNNAGPMASNRIGINE